MNEIVKPENQMRPEELLELSASNDANLKAKLIRALEDKRWDCCLTDSVESYEIDAQKQLVICFYKSPSSTVYTRGIVHKREFKFRELMGEYIRVLSESSSNLEID